MTAQQAREISERTLEGKRRRSEIDDLIRLSAQKGYDHVSVEEHLIDGLESSLLKDGFRISSATCIYNTNKRTIFW